MIKENKKKRKFKQADLQKLIDFINKIEIKKDKINDNV